MPDLQRPKEQPLRGSEEQPVAVVLAEEVEMVPDQRQAIDVTMLDDLEGTIALPEASPGAEGPDHAADEGDQVEVRRRLLAQGVEGPDLHEDVRVPCQGAEGVDIGVADRPVRPGAD